MNNQMYIEQITDVLAPLSRRVEVKSSLNLTDLNIHAENFFGCGSGDCFVGCGSTPGIGGVRATQDAKAEMSEAKKPNIYRY